jgi:pimeloyl-ACP methyl ester carboxylesterase
MSIDTTTTTHSLDIQVSPGWRLHADLHVPAGGEGPRAVQLLLGGLTYDRRYWELPGQNNYVRHAVESGYAVLALDRIGTGLSDRPAADQVTVGSNLDTVHQVVQALRAGHIGGHAFENVVAVGHSLGSGIAILESARHRDFDALVITGLLHSFGPRYEDVLPALHGAAEDEIFAGDTPPEGYLTTRPGMRADLYEHPGEVAPELSAYHEQTKSTVTLGEGMTLTEIYDADASREVTAPVLLVMGSEDKLFGGGEVSCDSAASVVEFERAFYTSAADLQAVVVPDAAHGINLHKAAPRWFESATTWLAESAGVKR